MKGGPGGITCGSKSSLHSGCGAKASSYHSSISEVSGWAGAVACAPGPPGCSLPLPLFHPPRVSEMQLGPKTAVGGVQGVKTVGFCFWTLQWAFPGMGGC